MTLGAHGIIATFRFIATPAIRKTLLVLIAAISAGLAWPVEARADPVAPSVTTNPTSTSVTSGGDAVFMAAASGDPAPSVQWQLKLSGGSFGNISGATSTTLTLTNVGIGYNGAQVKAIFTNSEGSATTSIATLTINTIPSVSTNPVNQVVSIGANAVFSASASGSPTPTVQWEVSTNSGASYSDVSGATSTTLTVTSVTVGQSGNLYRAKFTNVAGNDTSQPASLTVLQAPVVTANPSDTTVSAGQTAAFAAAASGQLPPTVQWQVSTDGGTTYNDVPAATFATLTISNAQASQNGNKYRAVFTNATGTATSNPATLTVNSAPFVTTHPSAQTVGVGDTATFTAAANGNPTPTVQWQVSTDGGLTFGDISGATSATLSFTTAAGDNGKKYRAVFTNSGGTATTNSASLTVTAIPLVTLNPVNVTVNAGQTATFTTAGAGAPPPTVKWQLSTDGGTTFNDIAGATHTTFNVPAATAGQSGNKYRAVFTNAQGSATSSAGTLTVQVAPTIATNPTDQTVNAGSTATFTASPAGGVPSPTVQWQVSTNGGGTFSDIPGATSTTLSFTAVAADNGKKYRAVFTNAVGSAPTTAALLTVIITTTTTLSSSSPSAVLNEPITLTATVTPTPTPGSGTVDFKEGAATLCPGVTVVNGQATCSASFATAGSHVVTAEYSGGANYAASSSSPLTISVIDQRFKTIQAIGNFLSLRDDMLLSNGPDGGRQIDRLLALQDEESGSGFAASNMQPTVSRSFQLGGDAGFDANMLSTGTSDRAPSNLDRLFTHTGLDGAGTQDARSSLVPTMGSLRAVMGDDGAVNASFSTSLSDIMRYVDDTQLGANEAGGSRLARHGPQRVDVWFEGHLTSFDDDRDGIDSSGHFGVAYLGVDYVWKPWLLVGLLGQYDDMRQTSISSAFRTEGAGWMAGPYLTARLSPHLFLQARGAWGLAANKVSPFLTYSDTFDSTRWLLSSSLTGVWSKGPWQFTPSASLAYVEDTTDAYVDHFSVLIPSVTSSLGQFKAEPEVSYRHLFADGTLLEPRLKASAIWNFSDSTSADSIVGTFAGAEELRGKVEAGVGVRFNDGVSIDLSGSYDGIGSSDYDAKSIALSARIPL